MRCHFVQEDGASSNAAVKRSLLVKKSRNNSAGIKTKEWLCTVCWKLTRTTPLERYYLDCTLYNNYYLVFIKGVGN
jgi:hypothetical protein